MEEEDMREPVRRCTSCNITWPRSSLLVKQVYFSTIGTGSKRKVVKARTVAHLCPECLEKDSAWGFEPYAFQKQQAEASTRAE